MCMTSWSVYFKSTGLTCAEAVRSSLSCIVTPPKASTVSFSQGSLKPAPPVPQTTKGVKFQFKIKNCQQLQRYVQVPSKRRPLDMHSSTRRKASPGPSGCWLLLSAFSTNSSIACQRTKNLITLQVHVNSTLHILSLGGYWCNRNPCLRTVVHSLAFDCLTTVKQKTNCLNSPNYWAEKMLESFGTNHAWRV